MRINKVMSIFVLLLFVLTGCSTNSMNSSINTPTVTQTSLPTSTPAPTNTPKPTITPTPIPEPVEFSGTGSKVIDFDHPWTGPTILKITNTGGGNFVVENYDSNNEKIDLLVNEIGKYNGTLLITIKNNDPETNRFSIQSSGNWTIQAFPFHPKYLKILDIPGSYQGEGDDIIFLSGNPDLITVVVTQENYVGIFTYSDDGRDLLLNEIAPYNGQLILPNNTYLLEIHCSGKWSIDITSR